MHDVEENQSAAVEEGEGGEGGAYGGDNDVDDEDEEGGIVEGGFRGDP